VGKSSVLAGGRELRNRLNLGPDRGRRIAGLRAHVNGSSVNRVRRDQHLDHEPAGGQREPECSAAVATEAAVICCGLPGVAAEILPRGTATISTCLCE